MLHLKSYLLLSSAFTLILTVAERASTDNPPEKGPPKDAATGRTARQTHVDPAAAQQPPTDKLDAERRARQQAEAEQNFKKLESERKLAQLQDDRVRREAKAEDDWNKLDPRIQNLIDPEITAAQYELVENCLTEYPAELLDTVDKAIRDDIVRLSELAGVESNWDRAAKPKAHARTKSLMQQIRDFSAIAPRHPDSKPRAASFEGAGSVEMAIFRGTLPSDRDQRVAGLRSDLVKAAIRGQKVTAEERGKLAGFFGVKPDVLAKVETEFEAEARAPEYEEIERYLQLHPKELLKHVESAYQDDKVTYLEYEVVKAVKEQTEIQAAKARIKARIHELWKVYK